MFDFAETTKDMTASEILNYYRNLYYAEPQVTERGIMANAINDYFDDVAPKSEVAKQIFEEIDKRIGFLKNYGYVNYIAQNIFEILDEVKRKYTEESGNGR